MKQVFFLCVLNVFLYDSEYVFVFVRVCLFWGGGSAMLEVNTHSPRTIRCADAISWSTGLRTTHEYLPWSEWLTLTIWRVPSSTK